MIAIYTQYFSRNDVNKRVIIHMRFSDRSSQVAYAWFISEDIALQNRS
jgi:hypothetical protein